MKKIIALTAVLAIMLSLASCSLFSTEKKDYENGGDIKLCDTFTHKDPEGVDFAARYAYCSAPGDPNLIDPFKEDYGIEVVQQFFIIYADANDKPLAQYEYYVCKDEENAKKLSELFDPTFYIPNGNVILGYSDAELTQQMIDANIQYASLTENSTKAYAEFTKEIYMFIDVE